MQSSNKSEGSKEGRTRLPSPNRACNQTSGEGVLGHGHFGAAPFKQDLRGKGATPLGAWAVYHHRLLGFCSPHSSTTPGRVLADWAKTTPLQTKEEV